MLTYTTARTQYGVMTNNAESSNLTYGMFEMNEAQRTFCARNGGAWWFLEKTATQDTVANQRNYTIPQSVKKIMDVYITVGSTIYSPIPVENADLWKRVLQSQTGTSDRTMFYYREGNTLYFDPIPASSSNTITIRYRKNIVDLRNADYTTGTITATNGDETITGSGSTFTAAMVGRFLQATTGDGYWYEIDSYTSATSIELIQKYEGTTVSGSNYTIGEVFVFPEAYQELPLLTAVGRYWQKNGKLQKAKMYFDQADILFADMQTEAGEKVEGHYISPISNEVFQDPNDPEPFISTSSFT